MSEETHGTPGVLNQCLRLLVFRVTSEELQALDRRHLTFGLIATWVVGIGRWWEDPRANIFQHSGIGSVAYVFILALFLWLILWPLAPRNFSYFNLLTFVSLTSPPAILYALPVRHGVPLELGQEIRLVFLGIVALWRVSMLCFYLGRGLGLSGFARSIATAFPLTLIVVALLLLNLEKVVFNFMGMIRPEDRSVNDGAYSILLLIAFLSVWLFVPLLICYAVIAVRSFRSKKGAGKTRPASTAAPD